VAIDDHVRVAFTDIHLDERIPSAMRFLQDAGRYGFVLNALQDVGRHHCQVSIGDALQVPPLGADVLTRRAVLVREGMAGRQRNLQAFQHGFQRIVSGGSCRYGGYRIDRAFMQRRLHSSRRADQVKSNLFRISLDLACAPDALKQSNSSCPVGEIERPATDMMPTGAISNGIARGMIFIRPSDSNVRATEYGISATACLVLRTLKVVRKDDVSKVSGGMGWPIVRNSSSTLGRSVAHGCGMTQLHTDSSDHVTVLRVAIGLVECTTQQEGSAYSGAMTRSGAA
jgi:hypothetical protein